MSTSVNSDGKLLIRPHLPEELVAKILETGSLSVFHIDDVDEDGEMTHEEYLESLKEMPRGPEDPQFDYSPVLLADSVRDIGDGEMPYDLARPETMLKNLIQLLKEFLVPGGYVLDGSYWYHPCDFEEIYHFEVKKNRITYFRVQEFDYDRARKVYCEEDGIEDESTVSDDDAYWRYMDECEGFYSEKYKPFGVREIKAYNAWLARAKKKARARKKPVAKKVAAKKKPAVEKSAKR